MEVSDQPHLPAALTQERASGIHSIEGWLSPRIGLDVFEKKEIFCRCRDSNPGSSDPYLSRKLDFSALTLMGGAKRTGLGPKGGTVLRYQQSFDE
jgi:hypothetical protein